MSSVLNGLKSSWHLTDTIFPNCATLLHITVHLKKNKKKLKKIAYFTKFVGMQKSEKSCIYHKMFCCFEQKKYCIHFKLSVHEDFGISAVKLSQELGTEIFAKIGDTFSKGLTFKTVFILFSCCDCCSSALPSLSFPLF